MQGGELFVAGVPTVLFGKIAGNVRHAFTGGENDVKILQSVPVEVARHQSVVLIRLLQARALSDPHGAAGTLTVIDLHALNIPVSRKPVAVGLPGNRIHVRVGIAARAQKEKQKRGKQEKRADSGAKTHIPVQRGASSQICLCTLLYSS
ncbi:unknown [Clostridium sp. CAG:448]|nr:unknown [Clostridium sp. CAG:448]